MNQKTYVGNAKTVKTKHGEIFKVSFSKADLAVLQNHLNERGYVNLDMTERRAVSEYGHTHSIAIDDWKPTQSAAPAPQQSQQVSNEQGLDSSQSSPKVAINNDNYDDDIPFN